MRGELPLTRGAQGPPQPHHAHYVDCVDHRTPPHLCRDVLHVALLVVRLGLALGRFLVGPALGRRRRHRDAGHVLWRVRYRLRHRASWVVISGRVDRIDNGKVYLVGDGFLSDAVLEGLSVDEQIPLDAGQTVTFTCKVGNYILGSIFLKDCHA